MEAFVRGGGKNGVVAIEASEFWAGSRTTWPGWDLALVGHLDPAVAGRH